MWDYIQAYTGSGTGLMALFFYLAVIFVVIASYWKMFEKAGMAGWYSLVPGYNMYKIFEISVGNGWLFLLLIVPVVRWLAIIWYSICLARAFGKSIQFGVGLIVLGPVFMAMLDFGDARYIGPRGDDVIGFFTSLFNGETRTYSSGSGYSGYSADYSGRRYSSGSGNSYSSGSAGSGFNYTENNGNVYMRYNGGSKAEPKMDYEVEPMDTSNAQTVEFEVKSNDK